MKTAGVESGNMSLSSPSGCSMMISLDDELEWQHGSRTHSPRTPTSSDVLKSLRRMSPPPTSSNGNTLLEGAESLDVLSKNIGFDAITNIVGVSKLRSCLIRGDLLCLDDGTSYHLGLHTPLKGRVIQETDDSTKRSSDKGAPNSTYVPLTLGSVWLSALAERTYESQLCALLRARKNLQEIRVEDRLTINRFLLGNLTVHELKRSPVWIDNVDGAPSNEIFDDYLSIRTRRREQLRILEEKKGLLEDQQMRLRRLLARELQRLHSTKPQQPIVVPPPASSASDASVVSNMLKRPKAPVATVAELTAPPPDSINRAVSEKVSSPSIDTMRAELRCLHVEWYRVSGRLRNAVEAQTVLERKLKRLRYVTPSNHLSLCS